MLCISFILYSSSLGAVENFVIRPWVGLWMFAYVLDYVCKDVCAYMHLSARDGFLARWL